MTIASALLFIASLNPGDSFIVDASASIAYTVSVSRDDLRLFVDDIGLFERNMAGVVGVDSLSVDTYLYRTSREVPLKGKMDANFIIRKMIANDTLTVYRTPDVHDPNWMECRVELTPVSPGETSISINLRLRMEREHGYEIHWLAPIVGADFLTDRMEEELEGMLHEFAERSSHELYQKFSRISQK